jgi:hypothetical protein
VGVDMYSLVFLFPHSIRGSLHIVHICICIGLCLPSFELLRRSGRSLSMGPYAGEIVFGLLENSYLPLDLFFC